VERLFVAGSWEEPINTYVWWEVILRMVLAVLLGGLVGWEREAQRKPAGLRTHILVSLAAAI